MPCLVSPLAHSSASSATLSLKFAAPSLFDQGSPNNCKQNFSRPSDTSYAMSLPSWNSCASSALRRSTARITEPKRPSEASSRSRASAARSASATRSLRRTPGRAAETPKTSAKAASTSSNSSVSRDISPEPSVALSMRTFARVPRRSHKSQRAAARYSVTPAMATPTAPKSTGKTASWSASSRHATGGKRRAKRNHAMTATR
mmetsp:Transcript_28580/g.82124  ORF Transcript_28580/g.82124 Transcript_28580/m.82124 type:complete len:203 (+) Transcript_28580:191-799(+)